MNTQTKNVDEIAIDEKVAELKLVSIPLKEAIERVINSCEIGNVIACYDTGHTDFDSEVICTEAADFVLKGLLGSLCYNVVDGYRGNGSTMLNNALDQVDQAAERDANFRTEKSNDQLGSRINWAARMDVQQSYRMALQDFVLSLYTAVTGERYLQRGKAPSGGKPETTEQSVADKIKARRNA